MFWKNKKVFVTGSSGFIGTSLLRRLTHYGAQVIAFDKEAPVDALFKREQTRITKVQGSLSNYTLLQTTLSEYSIDTIYHLGAQTQVQSAFSDPFTTYETNIRGTYCLLEACRRSTKHIKRIIIASSDKAYGIHDTLPYTEESSLQALYPYDVSKACTDLIALSYYHTYGLPIVVTRAGNVYGGGDFNWERLIPSVICNLYENTSPLLRGDGLSLRDYVFIEDIVEAYLLLGEQLQEKKLQGEAFNLGSNKPTKVIDIVSAIAKFMNKEHLAPIIQNAARGEIPHQYLSSKKAEKLIGWRPKVSLSLGLELTIAWYEKFFQETSVDSKQEKHVEKV